MKLKVLAVSAAAILTLAACGSSSIGTYTAAQTTGLMESAMQTYEHETSLTTSQVCYGISLQGVDVGTQQVISGYESARTGTQDHLDTQAVHDYLQSLCAKDLTPVPVVTPTPAPVETPDPAAKTCTTVDVATHKTITVEPGDNAVIGITEETCGADGQFHTMGLLAG